MSRKIVAVTGGAGFIGTNLLLALKSAYREAEIRSIDIRPPTYPVEGVTYVPCDVRNRRELEAAVGDVYKLFHLAAIMGTHESLDSPYAAFETNVQGTINVLECARKYNAEVFVAGMPGIWNNPYSISKDAAVRMALTYFETYQVRVSVLRWYSVYGPYQYLLRYNKAVPTLISKALQNKPLPIYGDGTQVADFIYSEDAVRYAMGMLEEEQWGKVVQCASGVGISVNDLAMLIIDLCDSSSEIEYLPMRKGEPVHSSVFADTTNLKRIFPNYKPTSLRQGLQQTVDYYRQHPAMD